MYKHISCQPIQIQIDTKQYVPTCMVKSILSMMAHKGLISPEEKPILDVTLKDLIQENKDANRYLPLAFTEQHHLVETILKPFQLPKTKVEFVRNFNLICGRHLYFPVPVGLMVVMTANDSEDVRICHAFTVSNQNKQSTVFDINTEPKPLSSQLPINPEANRIWTHLQDILKNYKIKADAIQCVFYTQERASICS